jgi:transcriptional regulator with XRE-family HTH domain
MQYMPAKPPPLTSTEARLLAQFGERMRLARLRRRRTAEDVATQAGITRVTLHRLERGEPAITVGTLARVMGALGLAEDIRLLARDDKAGHAAQDERLPRRRLPARIKLALYPQLKRAAWHIADPDAELTPEEAFNLYETNWRYIEPSEMLPAEAALLERLKATVGKGVMLV